MVRIRAFQALVSVDSSMVRIRAFQARYIYIPGRANDFGLVV